MKAGPSHTRNTPAGDVFTQSPYAHTQVQTREEKGTAGRVEVFGCLCALSGSTGPVSTLAGSTVPGSTRSGPTLQGTTM